MPILALFTGGRKTELAQLDAGDVQKLDGIWCIRITSSADGEKRLENMNSRRDIPVHPELERLGFLECSITLKRRVSLRSIS